MEFKGLTHHRPTALSSTDPLTDIQQKGLAFRHHYHVAK